MSYDWKAEIVRVAYWKQIAAHDPALPWHLPRLAASPDMIAAAEAAVGVSFPAEFKQFLGYANGWRNFFIAVDLFGTDDFLAGRAAEVMKRPELRAFIDTTGLLEDEVFVVGATDLDLDVFLLVSPKSKLLPGGVVWFASEEVDRYPTFSDFFAAMVNYNAGTAQEVARAAGISLSAFDLRHFAEGLAGLLKSTQI
jgi:hypothetical protein